MTNIKMSLSLDTEVKEGLRWLAERKHVAMSTMITLLVMDAVAAERAKDTVPLPTPTPEARAAGMLFVPGQRVRYKAHVGPVTEGRISSVSPRRKVYGVSPLHGGMVREYDASDVLEAIDEDAL